MFDHNTALFDALKDTTDATSSKPIKSLQLLDLPNEELRVTRIAF